MRALVPDLLLAVVLALLCAACASADGPVTAPVAHGSFEGLRWTLSVGVNFDEVVQELSLSSPDGEDGGGLVDVPLAARTPLYAGLASDLGARHAWEVDGLVRDSVHRVRVRTRTGVAGVRLRRVPARLLRRWPPLAHYRLFVRFLPFGRRPLAIAALGRTGRVVQREPLA